MFMQYAVAQVEFFSSLLIQWPILLKITAFECIVSLRTAFRQNLSKIAVCEEATLACYIKYLLGGYQQVNLKSRGKPFPAGPHFIRDRSFPSSPIAFAKEMFVNKNTSNLRTMFYFLLTVCVLFWTILGGISPFNPSLSTSRYLHRSTYCATETNTKFIWFKWSLCFFGKLWFLDRDTFHQKSFNFGWNCYSKIFHHNFFRGQQWMGLRENCYY